MDKTSCENIFLFVFSQAHPQFRRAEFESICLLFGIQPVPNFTPDESHYQLLHFDGGEAAVRCILGRSVLIKSAFRILINASSHEIVLEQLSKSNILQVLLFGK
uniref:tRNA (guanine(10)-N(2))-methyltransferase TRMT11 N-terminal domain-containing protein n=1 Tax=Meloidogyne incognita TaxID=6306 RepID=A0A914KKI9_MELIC